MRLAIIALVACASRHSMSAEDRRVIDEFRAADRVSVDAIATAMRQYDYHLTDHWDADKRVQEAVKVWRAMRARIEPVVLGDKELDTLLHQYLEQRTLAFDHAARTHGLMDEEAVNLIAYREYDETARATFAKLEAALAKLDVPALPAPVPDAGVVFQPPPPAPPGSAYFLVGDTVVALDDAGFHVVATEVDNMHVAENGVMWACSSWRAVKWDGKTSTVIKPKVYNQTCGIGPDGTLWVADGDEDGKDKVASFDGKQWKTTTAPLGGGWRGAEQLIVTRDGTVYAVAASPGGGRARILYLDKGAWHEVPREDYSIEHIFRGGDGNAWVIHQTMLREHEYPDALSQITRDGLGKPVFIDNHIQTSRLWANVDASGAWTIFDARKNVVVQGSQMLRLPAPNTQAGWYARPGGFAYDAAGRLWVDLVDGLNVIAPDGTRHVFPIGSVDALRRPIREVHVLGAGPTLPTAGIAATRTIQGTVKAAANADILMCVQGWGDPPCGKGVKTWSARADAEGRFTFEGVPRYRLDLQAHVGPRGKKRWRSLTGDCCDGEQTVLEFGLQPEPQY